MKKITTIGLGLLLVLPLTGFAASQIIDYSIDKAVKEVQKNDLSTKFKASSQPKLSSETNMYQGEFSNVLEVIQDKQSEAQDKTANFQSELTAYNMVYGFWMAQENYNLQQKNVNLAEKEHVLLEKKYEKGIVSQMELLNGEISINNAKAQLEDAEQGLTTAKYQLNQRLGNENLDQEISIDSDYSGTFKPLDSKKTKAENILSDALPEHLALLNVTLVQYGEALDSIAGLTVIGGDSYIDSIGQLQSAIRKVESEIANIEELIANLPEGETEKAAELSTQLQQLVATNKQNKKQLEQLNSDYAEAEVNLATAKEELKDYYQYQKKLVVNQQEQMKQQLELAAYQYETRFASLEDKIALYQDNVKKYKNLYAKNEKILENGMITETELEKVRMGKINSELQLNSAKKDYQILIKELELFKKGNTGAR
jgi:hypothetical protein